MRCPTAGLFASLRFDTKLSAESQLLDEAEDSRDSKPAIEQPICKAAIVRLDTTKVSRQAN